MVLLTMFENKRVSQQEHDILECEEYEERAAIMEYDGGLSREVGIVIGRRGNCHGRNR